MDDFSDDGLDELNEETLRELETKALQLTQPPSKPDDLQEYFDDDYDDDEFDHTVVIDELNGQPARHPVISGLPGAHRPRAPAVSAALGSHSRPPRPPQAYPALPQAPPLPTQSRPTPPPAFPPTSRHGYAATARASHAPLPGQQRTDVETLQAQLRALETELLTAKGEAALVRSKLEEAKTAHQTDVTRLKKQNTEQLAKHDHMLQAAVAAEKSATTELEFTRQDLRAELDRTRKGRADAGPVTPRKGGGRANAGAVVADGFDDMEMLPSPSKQQGRRPKDSAAVAVPVYDRTPTKAKRKRPAVDSPVMALETQADDDVEMAGLTADPTADPFSARPTAAAAAAAAAAAVSKWAKPSVPWFDFLPRVLSHRSICQPPTLDLFAHYALPSNPKESFTSIVLGRLPLDDPDDPVARPVDFCMLIIDLWSRCLGEKYYKPIYSLVALLTYMLHLRTTSVAPRIVSCFVPVAQATLRLVAEAVFRSPNGDLANHRDEAVRQLYLNIDTKGTMSLLHLVAMGCLTTLPEECAEDPVLSVELAPGETPISRFWRLMPFELVLMLLSPKQQEHNLFGILSLLQTSPLRESIGPITGDESRDPELVARVVIDRVSHQLTDPPKWAPRESYKATVLIETALGTLSSFARKPFGLQCLAQSNVAFPRIVAALHYSIIGVYSSDRAMPIAIDISDGVEFGLDKFIDDTWDFLTTVAADAFNKFGGKDVGDKAPVAEEAAEAAEAAEATEAATTTAEAVVEAEAAAPIPMEVDEGPVELEGEPQAEGDVQEAEGEPQGAEGGARKAGEEPREVEGNPAEVMERPVQAEGEPAPTAGGNKRRLYAPIVEARAGRNRRMVLIDIISAATLLLHTLVTSPKTVDTINVAAKLAAYPAGSAFWMLSLGRLAFADGEAYGPEWGIRADAVELANELMEISLTPEEVDSIYEVFNE